MSVRQLSAIAASVALGGCAVIPLSNPTEVPDLVHHVQCELQDMQRELLPTYPWLKTWAAAFTITKKAELLAAASPSFSLLGPFSVGSYAVPIGGGYSTDGIRTGTSKYTVRLDHLDLITCIPTGHSHFEGTLGIKEWFADVVTTTGDTYREPDTVGHTQQFSININGNVNPTFTLVRSKGNALFSLGRIDTNILDIAMTDAPPPKKPKPIEVIIVNPPGSGHTGSTTLTPFSLQGTQRTSPLRRRGSFTIENPNSEISNDARARLDNQLQELQLRNLFNR
jgi:hypothetical protein